MQAEVPKQHAFVLPAGGETACRCQVCRTVCRRAERRMLAIEEDGKKQVGDVAFQFVNRLSDYLFVLARFVGSKSDEKEEIWQK